MEGAELIAVLRRLQAARPGTWVEEVAIAVAAVGGDAARERLALPPSAPAEIPPLTPEQALAALEAELRTAGAAPPPAVPAAPTAPPAGPGGPPRRSMGD